MKPPSADDASLLPRKMETTGLKSATTADAA